MEKGYQTEDISSNPLIQKLMDHTVGYEAGFIRIKPQCFVYPSIMVQYLDKIKAFEVKTDDVWVCSFPKTGTTWTQEMVWCLMNNLDFDTSKKKDLDDRIPFFELKGALNESAVKFDKDQIDVAAALPSPRIIKTHLPYTMLPDQIVSGDKQPKMIYLVRNSRDTCVSMFHHWKLFHAFSGSFELWSEIFYAGLSGHYSSFFEHVKSYYKSVHTKNTFFVRYEDMKADLKAVVLKMSLFLDKEYSDADVDRFVEHLSFKNFKTTNSLNKLERVKAAQASGSSKTEEGAEFIRKGIVGDWENYFSVEMSEKFLAKEEDVFQSTGLRL